MGLVMRILKFGMKKLPERGYAQVKMKSKFGMTPSVAKGTIYTIAKNLYETYGLIVISSISSALSINARKIICAFLSLGGSVLRIHDNGFSDFGGSCDKVTESEAIDEDSAIGFLIDSEVSDHDLYDGITEEDELEWSKVVDFDIPAAYNHLWVKGVCEYDNDIYFAVHYQNVVPEYSSRLYKYTPGDSDITLVGTIDTNYILCEGLIRFNNKFFVTLVDYTGADKLYVYSSTDGVSWSQETEINSEHALPAPWRYSFCYIIATDGTELMMIAYKSNGVGGTGYTSLNSTDGSTWTYRTDMTGFPSQYTHDAWTYFGGKIIMAWSNPFAGTNKAGIAYSSNCGDSWSYVSLSGAAYGFIRTTDVFEFDNKVFVSLAGSDSAPYLGSLWYSTNGTSYTSIETTSTYKRHQSFFSTTSRLYVTALRYWSGVNENVYVKEGDHTGFTLNTNFSAFSSPEEVKEEQKVYALKSSNDNKVYLLLQGGQTNPDTIQIWQVDRQYNFYGYNFNPAKDWIDHVEDPFNRGLSHCHWEDFSYGGEDYGDISFLVLYELDTVKFISVADSNLFTNAAPSYNDGDNQTLKENIFTWLLENKKKKILWLINRWTSDYTNWMNIDSEDDYGCSELKEWLGTQNVSVKQVVEPNKFFEELLQ